MTDIWKTEVVNPTLDDELFTRVPNEAFFRLQGLTEVFQSNRVR